MGSESNAKSTDMAPGPDKNPRDLHSVGEAYGFYEELKKCPVYHSHALGGFYWLSRYKDVRDAALNAKFSSQAKGVLLPPEPTSPRIYALEQEGEEHKWARQLYAEALTPARLQALEPELVAATNRLIDEFAPLGACDLIENFTNPLPVIGVSKAIGFSVDSIPAIKELTKQFGTDPETNQKVIAELGGLVLNDLIIRRQQPREDYLSLVANAESQGQKMDEAELARFMFGFMHAGHHTTTSALGSLLFYVLKRPDLRARTLHDERFLARCIEEVVRLHPPFHAFHRTTVAPLEIDGVPIPQGSTIRLNYASANRDELFYDHSDQFDPDRTVRPHMGFGFGRHVCVGAPLARLEMKVAVQTLLGRLPDIQIVEDEIDFDFEFGTRASPRSIHVSFSPLV